MRHPHVRAAALARTRRSPAAIRATIRFAAGTLLALQLGATAATEPSASTRAEIAYLLDTLDRSDCRFARNGTWYDAHAARKHLERKYEYLLKKQWITTTEDFIVRAGSASSTSGEAYRVQCGAAPAIPSRRWLEEELRRYRAKPERTK
ncbi:MAG: DUF5329 family protein [Sulfurifustaceae bacterium]